MRYVILLLILSGCGQAPYPGDDARQADLWYYVNSFESDYAKYRDNYISFAGYQLGPNNVAERYQDEPIEQSFSNFKEEGYAPNIVANCRISWTGHREIKYDRDAWARLSPFQKKALVYHENGHCQLSREHRCSVVDGLGKSIMNPYLDSEYGLSRSVPVGGYYGEHFLNYLELELFSKGNQGVGDCG